jgi:hypothetical protein
MELNVLYLKYSELHTFIYQYKLYVDLYIKTYKIKNISKLDFILHLYKIPCPTK